ncbi:hypothetical protein PSN13_01134 [Micromonospora saelicesensis]|uniref:WxL domain surface cell wall-binding n=1 Tax=Micromonospora saelicesensis TaxID=285676 RepID=A0A328NZH9_9ACTN|nr:hypothetical protein [Micromonospora saelicesensis]RAO38162.1 hypothetical protein PSN13_01134 [Micromonospora saelicesensis]
MRTAKICLAGAAATAMVGFLAAPAAAAPTDTTDTTFEVLVGTLDIVAPATADLGDGAPGGVITGQLGVVTVTDSRGAADASWVASVTASVFQTGGGSPPETVLPEEIDYWSGPTTAFTGDGTFTPGQATAANALPLSSVTPLTAFTHGGGSGGNTASWNPTLEVNVPLDSIAGVYSGTVTHSVA